MEMNPVCTACMEYTVARWVALTLSPSPTPDPTPYLTPTPNSSLSRDPHLRTTPSIVPLNGVNFDCEACPDYTGARLVASTPNPLLDLQPHALTQPQPGLPQCES